jgi:hypothetical protein
MIAAIDWTNVLVALIAAAPAIIAALYSRSNNRQLRTPSDAPIGQQLEAAHHVAIANALSLAALAKKLGLPSQPEVDGHIQKATEDAPLSAPEPQTETT